MSKILLRDLIKEIILNHINEQENLPPIDPGPGQEPASIPSSDEAPSEAETPEIPSGVITRDEAKRLIKDTKGKFFTVTFTKKDGTERVMNARLGVKKYLKGGELPYDADEKGLIPVYDVKLGKTQKDDAYRMVNLSTIKNLKIGNNEYTVQ
jgi:hypothetical protein